MMWNELKYKDQLIILGLIEDLLLKQTNEKLQDGLVAALNELELWDNSPCDNETSIDEPYIAEAQLAEVDLKWDRLLNSLKR